MSEIMKYKFNTTKEEFLEKCREVSDKYQKNYVDVTKENCIIVHLDYIEMSYYWNFVGTIEEYADGVTVEGSLLCDKREQEPPKKLTLKEKLNKIGEYILGVLGAPLIILAVLIAGSIEIVQTVIRKITFKEPFRFKTREERIDFIMLKLLNGAKIS